MDKSKNNILVYFLIIFIFTLSYCVVAYTTQDVPTQDIPILNSSSHLNTTLSNLTVYNVSTADNDSDAIKNIYNWYKNGISLTILNLPFEGGSLNGTSIGQVNATRDYSPYANNGTVYNATWNKNGGYDGFGYYEFNGTNTYISLGSDSIFNLTKSMTVILWINNALFDNAATSDCVISKGTTYYGSTFGIWKKTDEGAFSASLSTLGTSTNFSVLTYDTLSDNGWHQLAFSFNTDNLNFSIYQDGLPVGSTLTSSETLFGNTNNLYLGGGVVNRYFNGSIDDVMIFNSTLSAEQILAIYENKTNMIVSQETQRGEIWNVTIVPNDGTADGNLKWSNELQILNQNFTINFTAINSTSTYNNSNGSLNLYFILTDPDGDIQEDIRTKWFINGIENSTFTNLTFIDAGNISKNQTWNVSVSVKAEGNWSEWTNNLSALYVKNFIPIPKITLVSSDVQNRSNGSLFVSWSMFDIDEEDKQIDNETIWTINGLVNSSWNNLSYIDANNLSNFERWGAVIRVYDGNNWSQFKDDYLRLREVVEDDNIFTFWRMPIDSNNPASYNMTVLNDMMANGMTYAAIKFNPEQDAEKVATNISYLRGKGYKILTQFSPSYTGDDDNKFLNASCVDKALCNNWNSSNVIDPSYTGSLWQRELNETWNMTNKSHPDLFSFDFETFSGPVAAERYFGQYDAGDDCNCKVVSQGIGYENYYSNWTQRGLDLTNSVKEANSTTIILHYGNYPDNVNHVIQEYNGSYGYTGRVLPGEVSGLVGLTHYVLPNIEILQLDLNNFDQSESIPYISFTHMKGYSASWNTNPFFYDYSVSREAGRRLAKAGCKGYQLFPNLLDIRENLADEYLDSFATDSYKYNGDVYQYWLRHSRELAAGFKEGLTYEEKNKILNPEFEWVRSKDINSSLINTTLIPVFWTWEDSNTTYNEAAKYANLSYIEKKSGFFGWRHTRYGYPGNRTIMSSNFTINASQTGLYEFKIWTKSNYSDLNSKIKFYIADLNNVTQIKIGEISYDTFWVETRFETQISNTGNYKLKIVLDDQTQKNVHVYFDNVSLKLLTEDTPTLNVGSSSSSSGGGFVSEEDEDSTIISSEEILPFTEFNFDLTDNKLKNGRFLPIKFSIGKLSEPIEATIIYQLKNSEHEIIFETTETKIINSNQELLAELDLGENLEQGTYELYVQVDAGESTFADTLSFKISEDLLLETTVTKENLFSKFWWVFLILIILLVLYIILKKVFFF